MDSIIGRYRPDLPRWQPVPDTLWDDGSGDAGAESPGVSGGWMARPLQDLAHDENERRKHVQTIPEVTVYGDPNADPDAPPEYDVHELPSTYDVHDLPDAPVDVYDLPDAANDQGAGSDAAYASYGDGDDDTAES
jgi:hypothetical protein